MYDNDVFIASMPASLTRLEKYRAKAVLNWHLVDRFRSQLLFRIHATAVQLTHSHRLKLAFRGEF